jgi:hypothetical protein
MAEPRLAALWERYVRVMGLEELRVARPAQYDLLRTSFYAGAGSAMDILGGMVDDQGQGPHPTPAGLQVIAELVEELEQYQQDWLART